MTATTDNWGIELWDQYDSLAIHSLKGIDFLEKYGNFIRDRAAIESEYAHKLRRLVKTYQPKKKDEEDYQFTSCQAFKLLTDEVNDLAGQHEVVAEELNSRVIRELNALVKFLKEERKKDLVQGQRLSQTLAQQIEELQRSKKSYEKAHREAEKAAENFQKADADLNLSRAEVEKQRSNYQMKTQICEAAKISYATQLQETNNYRRVHFQTNLPDVLRHLQELDEKRIKNIKNFIYNSVEIERSVFPIIEKCLDGILKAGDIIDEKQDTRLVIEKFKSGYTPPEDIQFEYLQRGGSDTGSANYVNNITIKQKDGGLTVKGTITSKAMRKKASIFRIFSNQGNAAIPDGKDDYSDLPPNQRRKKLIQKIDELKQKVGQETATRDGLMKMKSVYEANPALGDPMTVEGQLNECSHTLEKIQSELKRFMGYLTNMENSNSVNNSPKPMNGNGRRHHRRNSGGSAAEEESLSSCSNSPESGLGTSHTSLPGVDSDPDQYDGHQVDESEYYEPEVMPSIGICKAIYPFEATSEGSIPMSQDEELHLIELDQGDGWTRVRRRDGDCEEGFVPTSYVEISLKS